MKKLLLTLLAFCIVSFSANAGILIEPYLNFLDNTSLDGTGWPDIDSGGMSFGARVGFKQAGLWGA